jgi:type I restriction enzyme M protein
VHYRSFDIQQDDTLETPHHLEKRFSAVVANPPFSADWSANDGFKSDERFADYGKLAPKSKADFAFVQHMLHQLDDNGTMAVVLPHGVLFRGAAEGHIRRYLIEQKNCLDAVIGLPANIFYGTNIPTFIMVLKKDRINKDDVLFIDAKSSSGKGKNQDHLREEDLSEILKAYQNRKFISKYSYVASIKEIKDEHNFNLNIPRYVDTYEEEALIDLKDTSSAILAIDKLIKDIDSSIDVYSRELSISAPVIKGEV